MTQNGGILTIARLAAVGSAGDSIEITATYTVPEGAAGKTISNTAVVAAEDIEDEDEEHVEVKSYTVTITPADIVNYTGGSNYSGTVDSAGNVIGNTQYNGLPEPGYYLILSNAVNEWIAANDTDKTTPDAERLDDILTLTYQVGAVERTWKLIYLGVYSREPNGTVSQYVYSMSAVDDHPVSLRVFDDTNDSGDYDESDKTITTDDIMMSELVVGDTYHMTIDGGLLDQSQVQAQFTLGEGAAAKSITCNVEIGTGELLVKSVTDIGTTTNAIEDNGDAVASGTLTAVADSTVHYYVNDSEVAVDPDRVQLLVDSVSNSTEFNRSMEQDAINKADTQDGVSLSDAQAESFYLDLVDTQNGNTVVTLGDDELTIYWPMPSDADENGEFYIVHYDEMDRTQVSSLQSNPEIIEVTRDGDHLVFQVGSFSPFVLVYEKEDSGSSTGGGGSSRPSRPTLNTEDHYSYIIGYSDGTLQPYGTITRGEVATIFFRLLTDDSREEWWSQVNDYSDCNSDLWCNNAISTLSNMGIIDGFSDGTFRPYAKITRAQFAKIAVGFFETTREDYQGYFTDVDIDAWYTEYVEAAARVGLIEGFNDGTFRPNTNITRAQACVIVNRALGRAPDEDRLLDEDEMITWPDNNPDDWFYADMQEATNSHDYTWTTVSGDKVENWTDKLPQRDWAALEHAWSTAHSAPGGEVTK